MRKLILVLFYAGCSILLSAQDCQFSSGDHVQIATFGNMSEISCVDDDFSQTLFITIPENVITPFYVRIFDPDCGGENDLSLGLWETNTSFEVYGGDGCISESDARKTDPTGAYKSGTLLAKELFAEESAVDGTWFAFGPFNVKQGESINEFEGYSFFKLLVEGSTGDDGNMYKVFVSSSENDNVAIEQATIFHYELTYLNTESQKLDRFESGLALENGISLPLKLEPVKEILNFNLIAVPD